MPKHRQQVGLGCN